ncbi:uncharacterized protein [Dysidea avara]|uniref:uncharacterized protein n=1 Tax=Dysidea avara TaxID=196820 RepID=UPI0033238684
MESPFVTDCWQIIELFSKLETLRFADFVQVWKETRFVYLQGVGQDEYQQREILVQLFSTASAYLSDCFPVNVRVAALYLLYALYNTQTHEPSVQIRLVPEMWIKLEELHMQLRNEGHCDADYIACKLKQDKALRLTATPTQLSLGNWGGDIGERALVGFIHSHILSDESCLLLQVLDSDNISQVQSALVAYQQVKLNNSSLLPSGMLRPSTVAKELHYIKENYLSWRNQGIVTTPEVDTVQASSVPSARQRIVEKAFSSDTTSSLRRKKRKSSTASSKSGKS